MKLRAEENFSLSDVSLAEHKFVVSAEQKFPDEFVILNDLLNILRENFIVQVDVKSHIFLSFFSQVLKFFILSALSAARQHRTQSSMCVRQLLEAGCKAAYAIHFPDADIFVSKNEDGALDEIQNSTKVCYDWLDLNYPELSRSIKDTKDSINDLYAHSNLITSQENFEAQGNKYNLLVFDRFGDDFVSANLWLVSTVALKILFLIFRSAQAVETVKLCPSFEKNYKQIAMKIESVRQKLKNNQSFAK